jgi:hypothetical protein
MPLLSDEQWEIISQIHIAPRYRFMGDKLKAAQEMEKAGMLQSIGNKMFIVTKTGEKLYAQTNTNL